MRQSLTLGVQKAGVDVALVHRQPVVEPVTASGQIAYDQTRFGSLSSRVPDTVFRVEKKLRPCASGRDTRAGRCDGHALGLSITAGRHPGVSALARMVIDRGQGWAGKFISVNACWSVALLAMVLCSAQAALRGAGICSMEENLLCSCQ